MALNPFTVVKLRIVVVVVVIVLFNYIHDMMAVQVSIKLFANYFKNENWVSFIYIFWPCGHIIMEKHPTR